MSLSSGRRQQRTSPRSASTPVAYGNRESWPSVFRHCWSRATAPEWWRLSTSQDATEYVHFRNRPSVQAHVSHVVVYWPESVRHGGSPRAETSAGRLASCLKGTASAAPRRPLQPLRHLGAFQQTCRTRLGPAGHLGPDCEPDAPGIVGTGFVLAPILDFLDSD